MLLRRLFLALGCAALAATTLVLIMAAVLLNTARRQVEKLPAVLANQLDSTRRDLRDALKATDATLDRNLIAAIAGVNDTLNRQADAARITAATELGSFRIETDRQLADAINRLDRQMTRANHSIAELASVGPPVRTAVTKIDSALPFYTDCDAGMCLANVIYGIGQNTERTLRAVDKTIEVIAAKSPPVAESVEKSAAAVEMRSRQSILRNLFFNLKLPAK